MVLSQTNVASNVGSNSYVVQTSGGSYILRSGSNKDKDIPISETTAKQIENKSQPKGFTYTVTRTNPITNKEESFERTYIKPTVTKSGSISDINYSKSLEVNKSSATSDVPKYEGASVTALLTGATKTSSEPTITNITGLGYTDVARQQSVYSPVTSTAESIQRQKQIIRTEQERQAEKIIQTQKERENKYSVPALLSGASVTTPKEKTITQINTVTGEKVSQGYYDTRLQQSVFAPSIKEKDITRIEQEKITPQLIEQQRQKTWQEKLETKTTDFDKNLSERFGTKDIVKKAESFIEKQSIIIGETNFSKSRDVEVLSKFGLGAEKAFIGFAKEPLTSVVIPFIKPIETFKGIGKGLITKPEETLGSLAASSVIFESLSSKSFKSMKSYTGISTDVKIPSLISKGFEKASKNIKEYGYAYTSDIVKPLEQSIKDLKTKQLQTKLDIEFMNMIGKDISSRSISKVESFVEKNISPKISLIKESISPKVDLLKSQVDIPIQVIKRDTILIGKQIGNYLGSELKNISPNFRNEIGFLKTKSLQYELDIQVLSLAKKNIESRFGSIIETKFSNIKETKIDIYKDFINKELKKTKESYEISNLLSQKYKSDINLTLKQVKNVLETEFSSSIKPSMDIYKTKRLELDLTLSPIKESISQKKVQVKYLSAISKMVYERQSDLLKKQLSEKIKEPFKDSLDVYKTKKLELKLGLESIKKDIPYTISKKGNYYDNVIENIKFEIPSNNIIKDKNIEISSGESILILEEPKKENISTRKTRDYNSLIGIPISLYGKNKPSDIKYEFEYNSYYKINNIQKDLISFKPSIKSKENIIDKYKENNITNINSNVKNINKNINKETISFKENFIPKIDINIKSIQDIIPKQKQEQRSLLQERQLLKYEFKPMESILPKFRYASSNLPKFKQGFIVEVGKLGKTKISERKSFENVYQAQDYLKKKLKTTLAASGKITDTSGKVIDVNFGDEFVASKSEKGRIVQRAKFRLSSREEKEQIRRFKL